jgi:dihydroflavonol-4-reductase
MTVLVTGASGHLGANLVRALLAEGRTVRALIHHDRRGMEGLDVETVQGDVCDPASLRRACAGAEVVYHAAARIAISGKDAIEAINVDGTRNVVEACLRSDVRRLIHLSSIHAFQQEPLDQPLDEDRPLVDTARGAPYGRSKAAAEHEVRAGIGRGLDAVILNPTAMIGPYDHHPSHIGQVLLALCHGRMPALIAGGFDWVDVRDVVRGALRAEERAVGGARYLLSGHWASACELSEIVAKWSGVRAPWFVCPLWLGYAVAPFAVAWARLSGKRPLFTPFSVRTLRSNRQISHARAAHDLGYAPRPFEETVTDTLRWFAGAGYLDLAIAPRTVEES